MKRKKELLVVLTSLLVIVLSVTVAYFTVQIIGEGKELSVSTANLQIIYEDTDGSITGSNIKPPWSSTKTFKVSNSSNATYEYDIIIEDLVNTFVLNYLEYKITSSNGYNMTEYKPVPKSASATDTVLAYSISIDEDEIHNYTIEFRYRDANVDQSEDMGKTLSGRIMIQEGTELAGTFMTQLLADNPTVLTRTDFSTVLSTENTGTLYSTDKTEDGSLVYYFAGNAKNNWVKLATTTTRNTCTIGGEVNDMYVDDDDVEHYYMSEEECTEAGGTYNAGVEADALWRIIRTNEDGSIRLLYTGTGASDADYSIYDLGITGGNGASEVSYMYGSWDEGITADRGNTNDSGFKIEVDKFYQNVIGDTYDKYVSKTAIYCNDRALVDGSDDPYEVGYGIYDRISSYLPSYKCGANKAGGLYETTQSVADKFSASTASGGNGKLRYPAALMTADEVAFAGGKWGVASAAWYTYGKNNVAAVSDNPIWGAWWLLSPANCEFCISIVKSDGTINSGDLTGEEGIRPVISLKSCVNWVSGDGSETSPYVVSVSDTCAAAEN